MIESAILFHVYSGQLFFTAAGFFVIGTMVRRLRLLTLLALSLAALSGTPMPVAVATPLLLAATASIIATAWKPDRRLTGVVRGLAVIAVLVAVALELPWHFPSERLPRPQRLIVLGDSLSSGGFGETTRWTDRLGAINFASPSETVASAALIEWPEAEPGDLVLVELGGNDMLDGTPFDVFESALDQLLTDLQPRPIVMLELPLVPGAWGYGAVQRRLASRHRVVLVPKRFLAGVLTGPGNTSDGLHLTEKGHEHFARGLPVALGWDQ